MEELVEVLAHERRVLENLVFRLVEARWLLATGEARFLRRAASDIEVAAIVVKEAELCRATVVQALSGDDRTDIGTLARLAVQPWAALLEDHRASLGHLATEVGAALEGTHELAVSGLERVHGVASRGETGLGDHLSARWATAPAGPRRERTCSLPHHRTRASPELDDLDREITAAGYRAVLDATRGMGLPSLVAFLA